MIKEWDEISDNTKLSKIYMIDCHILLEEMNPPPKKKTQNKHIKDLSF